LYELEYFFMSAAPIYKLQSNNPHIKYEVTRY
jgi:hypothetical protein